MVTGNEYIFGNIYQARDYILEQERNALKADARRQKPLMCVPANVDFTKPFTPDAVQPIPVDNLDYPFSGYFNNAPENAFIMKRLFSGRYAFEPNLKCRKYLFRGETEFHSPCRPNLYRDPGKKYFLDSMIHGDEMFRLILSHPLVQLLDLGVDLDGRHYRFEMNLYGLIQHYYNKSALLDLTSDIDVALFFATQEYDWESDTYSPIVDENHECGVLYYYDIDVFRDFRKQADGELLSTIGLQVFPRSGRQSGFLYQCGKDRNFNELPQLKAFRFKHAADIAREIYEKMDGGKKLFPRDILQLHWRNAVRDENKVSVDAVKINLTRNPHETVKSITDKLRNDYRIDVDEYKPVLTTEELHEYYESMKDGRVWREFCSQIFIPGDTGGRMMADLLNVPNKEEYKWAFVEGIDHSVEYDKGYLLKKYKHILEG